MSTTYTYAADLTQRLPDIPADSIVSHTLYSGDDLKATLFGFAAGQELSEHTASQPAILYFVEGEADLALGADTMNAHVGTWVHMPAHLPHSIRAKTRVVMLLLLLKTGQ